jgi:hypothetical protein
MQDNNEPLATEGLRAAYAVQGNDKPLAKMGNWDTTFNNPELAKALMIKLIVPIATPHHRNEAP